MRRTAGGRWTWCRSVPAGLTPLTADILRPPGYLPMSFAEWDRWRYPDRYDWDLLRERDRAGIRANGVALVAGLLDGVVRAGVRACTGTRLTGVRDGHAELAHDGQPATVGAATIILATGGFDWDQELRVIYQPAAQRASGAPPTNTGDGLRIAADAGAALDNLAEGWWMPMLAIPGETLLGEQYYRSLIRERGLPRQIMVNAAGRRFVNEALPYNEIGKALHRQLNHGEPNHGQDGPVHLIFDEGYRARYPMPGVPADGPVPDWVGHGRTLGELAARIGASTVALAETVRRWNASCAGGADPEFGRGEGAYQRFCGDPAVTPNPSLGPLDQPPFYAVEVLAGTIGTKGGPVTDTDGQVLRADGSPVPGLYAAGNVAAFWAADGYPGPGATLAAAMTMGYRGAARRKERTLTCMTVEAGRGLIGSLLHGLEILDMFERDRPKIGIGEMAQQLGLHRSTTSRLAATLAVAGYLEPAGEPGRYRLSGRLAALGELAAAEGDVRRTALPYLRELVRELGETGHLGVLEGSDAVTIEVVDGWQTVRMHSWVGKRSPAHCSSIGKALLAGLSPAEFAARYPGHPLEPRTDRTITDPGVLRAVLAKVRQRGYAVDQEELEPHLCCVAAPVFDRTGAVVASISVSGPDSRIGEASIPAVAAAVCRAAGQISARLGAPRDIPDWSSHDLGGLPRPGPDGRPDGRPRAGRRPRADRVEPDGRTDAAAGR